MPVISAVAGLFVGLGLAEATATAIATSLVSLGASLVLSGVAKLLSPRPKASISGGTQVNVRQPISSWRIIYGTVRTGGIITFIESDPSVSTGPLGITITTQNQFLNVMFTLAGHKIHALGNMYFDDEYVPIGAGGANGHPDFHFVTGRYAGVALYEWNLGTDSQSALPGLVDLPSGLWTTNHRQLGRAGVHVSFFYVPTVVANGLPTVTWDVEGKEVLDIRLSPPTEVFSNNPALCLRDYLTNTDYGLGATEAEIDDTSFIAAANVCDEEVPLKDTGSPPQTIKRYTCDGIFETSQLPKDVIQALLSSCAGRLVYTNGTYKLYAGAYRTPNADTLTEDDLRGPISVQVRQSKRDICNSAKGLFISPTNKWQPSDFPPYQNASYVAEDNGEVLWKDVEYQFTTVMQTAQRLAKIEVERTRRQVVISMPCKLSQYKVAPLDTIKVTNSRFGWTDKTFEVINCKLAFEEDDQGLLVAGVDITAQETDAGIYDWDPDADETVVDAAGDVIAPYPFPVVSGPSNRSYRPLSNPLSATDAGGSPGDCTILVDDFTMRISGLLDTPYDSGSITGLDYNTLYYVFFIDQNAEGGTVTYYASTTKEDAIADGVFFLGSCVTPRPGAPDTIGNNDGGGGAENGGADIFLMSSAADRPLGPNSTGNGIINNPENLFDNDLTTFAELVATADGGTNRASVWMSGPPGLQVGRYSSLKLKIRAEGSCSYSPPAGGGSGTDASIWYGAQGLNNGAAIGVFTVINGGGPVLQTFEFDLPRDINPAQLVVNAYVDVIGDTGGGTMRMKIYGAWIEARQ